MVGGRDIITGYEEYLGEDSRHVYYLNSGDGFMSVYIYQKNQPLYFKYMQFLVCQLYLKKGANKCNNVFPTVIIIQQGGTH